MNIKSGFLKGIVLFLILLHPFWAASASAAEKFTIAVVKSRDIDQYNQAIDGFKGELTSRGITPDINYYDLQKAKGRENGLLQEAKDQNPHLILAVGTEAAVFCKDFFKEEPVVFTMVLDSVEGGITEDYSPTGSNLTGIILRIPVESQLRKIKETVPGINTIGMLYDARTREERARQIYNEAGKLGLGFVAKPVTHPRDIPSALDSLVREVDAIWAEVDPLVYTPQTAQEIILTTFRQKIPFMAFSSHYVKAGALLALECDYYDIGRQTGEMADSILKGTNPGTIPIASPRKSNLIINKHTAKIIGIDIPPSILKEAVEVFGEDIIKSSYLDQFDSQNDTRSLFTSTLRQYPML